VTGAAGAFTLIASERYLDLDAFAPLAQLWTIWAVLAAGLTFSFQQWAAVHSARRRDVLPGGAAPHVGAILAAGSIVVLVVSFAARDALFHSSSWVWPVAAGILPMGTALNGIRRGQLARQRRLTGLAMIIAGENLIRLAVSATLIAVGADGQWFAIAMLAGFIVIVGPSTSSAVPSAGTAGVAALSAAAAAGFLAYAFMFGSPLLLAAAGGTAAEVSALFLVLTGVRIPFVVLQAVVPQLAVWLDTADHQAAAIGTTRRRLVVVAGVGSGAAAAVGYFLGDLIIGSVFGIRGEVGAIAYSLLSAASVLAACALISTVVLVVEGRSRRIALAWGVPAATAPIVAATGVIAETTQLSLWLVASQATVVVITLVRPRHSNHPA
jgi:hypothetical protein